MSSFNGIVGGSKGKLQRIYSTQRVGKVGFDPDLKGGVSIDKSLTIVEVDRDLSKSLLEGSDVNSNGRDVRCEGLISILSSNDPLLDGSLISNSLVQSSSSSWNIGLNSINVSSKLLDDGEKVCNCLISIDLPLEDSLALDITGSGLVFVPCGVNSILEVRNLSGNIGRNEVSGWTCWECLRWERIVRASWVLGVITN